MLGDYAVSSLVAAIWPDVDGPGMTGSSLSDDEFP